MSAPEFEVPSWEVEPLRTALARNAYIATASSVARGEPLQGAYAEAAPGEDGYVCFRALTGRYWRYTGKRARVFNMLASGRSISQWDCLPWHTRLGATIHVMREDGLAIETVLEGGHRHARYTLRTVGNVVERGQ